MGIEGYHLHLVPRDQVSQARGLHSVGIYSLLMVGILTIQAKEIPQVLGVQSPWTH